MVVKKAELVLLLIVVSLAIIFILSHFDVTSLLNAIRYLLDVWFSALSPMPYATLVMASIGLISTSSLDSLRQHVWDVLLDVRDNWRLEILDEFESPDYLRLIEPMIEEKDNHFFAVDLKRASSQKEMVNVVDKYFELATVAIMLYLTGWQKHMAFYRLAMIRQQFVPWRKEFLATRLMIPEISVPRIRSNVVSIFSYRRFLEIEETGAVYQQLRIQGEIYPTIETCASVEAAKVNKKQEVQNTVNVLYFKSLLKYGSNAYQLAQLLKTPISESFYLQETAREITDGIEHILYHVVTKQEADQDIEGNPLTLWHPSVADNPNAWVGAQVINSIEDKVRLSVFRAIRRVGTLEEIQQMSTEVFAKKLGLIILLMKDMPETDGL